MKDSMCSEQQILDVHLIDMTYVSEHIRNQRFEFMRVAMFSRDNHNHRLISSRKSLISGVSERFMSRKGLN